MPTLKLTAHYNQQFDTDSTCDVSAESYGGWKTTEIEIALEHTAIAVMRSAFRQAVTAIENKETVREEWAKEIGLWRVVLLFRFVFDVGPFVQGLAESSASV